MKKTLLALIVLANLGNSSEEESFVKIKKKENFNKSFIVSHSTPRYNKDRNYNIEKSFVFECPKIENPILGSKYTYQVKKNGCSTSQIVIDREIDKNSFDARDSIKCFLKNQPKDCNITVDDIKFVKRKFVFVDINLTDKNK